MSNLEFITPEWPAPENVRAVVTTRAGGFGKPPYDCLNLSTRVGDDPEAVKLNRQRLSQALTLPGEPLWLSQVHGNRMVYAPAAARDHDPEADAAWCDQPGVVCALQTADCLPLLLCDKAGRWVAALHCGWRGLAGGIIATALPALPGKACDCLAWLGPAIGPQAFEVGAEVRTECLENARAPQDAFRHGREAGKFFCDMYALARFQLGSLGVEQIGGGGWCTATDEERFFSFRRDGDTGRMATLIWLA